MLKIISISHKPINLLKGFLSRIRRVVPKIPAESAATRREETEIKMKIQIRMENIERALGECEKPLTHSTVCAFDKNSCYENIKIE